MGGVIAGVWGRCRRQFLQIFNKNNSLHCKAKIAITHQLKAFEKQSD